MPCVTRYSDGEGASALRRAGNQRRRRKRKRRKEEKTYRNTQHYFIFSPFSVTTNLIEGQGSAGLRVSRHCLIHSFLVRCGDARMERVYLVVLNKLHRIELPTYLPAFAPVGFRPPDSAVYCLVFRQCTDKLLSRRVPI